MHVSVHQFWKRTALQVCTYEKKNQKRVSKISALPPTTQIKSSRPIQTVCVHAHASSFALSASCRSCQVLSTETFSKETFSKEIWTSLALSFCEDISQHFRDGREREQVIFQQGITVVPLNSLNKQQEVQPEAEERLMDMSLFPSSQKAQTRCFSTVSDSEFQEIVF